MADIRIQCEECGIPFVFYGLETGLDIDGSSVSVDGTEARLSIGPKGENLAKHRGVKGFTVKYE